MRIANGSTVCGGNADDALTGCNFRTDSRNREPVAGDGKEPLVFFVGNQNEAVVISKERREVFERSSQQGVKVITGSQTFCEGIQALQMIGDGLLSLGGTITLHGTAA